MIRQAQVAVASLLMRSSERYHRWAVRRYWSRQAAPTHADMSAGAFDFYAGRIAELLGPPARAGRVLDHGAGEGSIGMRLAARGHEVEFSEFAAHFIARIRAAGHRCHAVDAVPAGHYDTVFVNNAIFYVHPSRLTAEIAWLLARLRPGGRLLLLDVPTRQRAHRLGGGPARRLWRRLSGVYQAHAGGFFVDEARIRAAFPGARISDSWSDYRCHIEIGA